MTKTKAQLRAEAVERLKDYEGWHNRVKAYDRDPDLLMAVIGADNWCMTWQENRDVLIDLLTDDEPVNGKKPDSLQDDREKLEAAAQTTAGCIYGRGFTNGLADAWNDDEVDTAANQIIQLLDRQVLITTRHCMDVCADLIAENAELREKLDAYEIREAEEADELLVKNAQLKDSANYLYTRNTELIAENIQLKAKLRKKRR